MKTMMRRRCDLEHICDDIWWHLPVEQTYQQLVRAYFTGAIKPPFNHDARTAAGLTPTFYLALAEPISKPGPTGTNHT